MHAPSAFSYAVIRVVPDAERQEFLNVGIVLFAESLGFLGARVALDEARLRAVCPSALLDLELVRAHLAAIPTICSGGPAAGPIGALPLRERWSWLVSPRSTILQTSAPHAGVTVDPEATLGQLLARLVGAPA